MSLYTWTVSTMIETYVEMRMVNESEKKKDVETLSKRNKLENAPERCLYLMC